MAFVTIAGVTAAGVIASAARQRKERELVDVLGKRRERASVAATPKRRFPATVAGMPCSPSLRMSMTATFSVAT